MALFSQLDTDPNCMSPTEKIPSNKLNKSRESSEAFSNFNSSRLQPLTVSVPDNSTVATAAAAAAIALR